MSRIRKEIAEGIRDGLIEGLAELDRRRFGNQDDQTSKNVYTKEFTDDAEFRSFILDVVNIHKWKSVVWDLDQKLRERVKYISEPRILEETDVWDEARSLLHSLLEDEGLNLHD